MTRNLGQTSLRRKRRATDPMAAYDRLPPDLRKWLADASLPWSPKSAQRIWVKSLAKGMSHEEALAALARAEAATLSRDRCAREISGA